MLLPLPHSLSNGPRPPFTSASLAPHAVMPAKAGIALQPVRLQRSLRAGTSFRHSEPWSARVPTPDVGVLYRDLPWWGCAAPFFGRDAPARISAASMPPFSIFSACAASGTARANSSVPTMSAKMAVARR